MHPAIMCNLNTKRYTSGNKRATRLPTSSVLDEEKAVAVVSDLLYEMPGAEGATDRHILTVFVDDESGVLSKISGMLAARGFNINSLTVGTTNVKGLSRMTIVLRGETSQIIQCERQLEDLVNVWAVVNYREKEVVERELVLIKVSTVASRVINSKNSTASRTPNQGQLQVNHYHRQAVLDIVKLFNGTVHDIGEEHVVIELSSWRRRIDALIKLLDPYGVIETARSGVIAMVRSPVGEKEVAALKQVVDIANLPPS